MNLNQQQESAVQFYGQPQVIIAGAGTGKTTVMIEKINGLIQTGKHAPQSILALTFTNKAANEMRERFQRLDASSQTPWFGTFHSFCLQLLKKSPGLNEFGVHSNFTIIDSSQQKELIGELMKQYPSSMSRKPKDVISKISRIKQSPRHHHSELLSQSASDIRAIFNPYNQKLKQLNCLDFDDLLLFAYDILALRPDVLADYNRRFEFIIVDEYQDTNQIQNDITLLLAKGHQRICVVGDFDQTIYGWRGARVENLLEFNQAFSNVVVHKLETNYRSSTEILEASNQLIAFNANRESKRLIGQRSSGSKPQHIVCFNEREEAGFIAKTIKELQSKHQYKYGDFSILYRTNQQSRAVEEALVYHNIPHQIVGTTGFYQRVEVKHAIAYLQCLRNINQPVWFERAILNPARGVGKVSIQALIDFSLHQQLTIEDAIFHPECPLKPRYLAIVQSFLVFMNELSASPISVEKKLEEIFNFVQFNAFIRKFDNYMDRLDNVKELMSKLKEVSDLDAFLDEITLFQGGDSDDDSNKVSCLTIHLAKGLEFPIVFIPGFEKDLMPLRSSESIEEERRLAYVGITRGKDQVYLLSAYKRLLMGEDWYHDPSLFIQEMNGCLDVKVTNQVNLMAKPILYKMNDLGLTYDVIQIQGETPTLQATNVAGMVFNLGDVVYHPNLGTGTIESVSGEGDGRMYDIQFSVGRKKLMAKFAPLQLKT
jgi:DNA helicase-2/ATP-dependent DNA helicase PcrA